MIIDMTERNRKTRPRHPFGERLAAARVRAGLTQAELGEKLGMSQRAIASWERQENASPNPVQMVQLTKILEVSAEELVCGAAELIRQKPGPQGKLRKIFHEVSVLPRYHQKDVIEVLEMYVKAKKKKMEQQVKVVEAQA